MSLLTPLHILPLPAKGCEVNILSRGMLVAIS